MRKLASVQRVLEVLPIDGADNIELVTVLGWQCVVKKGEFKPGDLGVYFEIDSVVPDTETFQFLKSRRIKTIKLRGQLSQGLMLPTNAFYHGHASGLPHEDMDCTDELGVTKYDPQPANSQGANLSVKRPSDFPQDVPKTDEERIQSCPRLLQKLAGKPYVITLKMDGCSATYTMHDGKFTVCSRNYIVPESEENESTVYWRVARKYPDIQRYCEEYPFLAIQGEICAPGLQKNRTGVPNGDVRFYAFSIFCKENIGGCEPHYLASRTRIECWDDLHDTLVPLNIPIVPVVETGGSFTHTQASLLALAEGKYEGTNNEREGIVVRSIDTTPSERVSFKVISNRYLLKGGE